MNLQELNQSLANFFTVCAEEITNYRFEEDASEDEKRNNDQIESEQNNEQNAIEHNNEQNESEHNNEHNETEHKIEQNETEQINDDNAIDQNEVSHLQTTGEIPIEETTQNIEEAEFYSCSSDVTEMNDMAHSDDVIENQSSEVPHHQQENTDDVTVSL